ncbi:protein SpAN-like [Amphiura filiformis]|uniref:protein SpAN-like n=1 Tax=Amphiura filiformis TaxID=82378 RepID=UPI003B2101E7
MGAIPVLVESQAEADYLKGKLKADHSPASHDGFWLRCKDNRVEGQWTCDSSSNYWNSAGDNKGFWDWRSVGSTEPDGGTAENCLVLDFDGKLRDVPCQLTTSFNAAACEITMVAVTPAPTGSFGSQSCGVTYTTPTGTLTSPNYPSNYPDSSNCWNIISVVDATSVLVKFTAFNTEDTFDYLYFGVGTNPDVTLALGSFTGPNLPDDFELSSASVWFLLVSDRTVTRTGFSLTWAATIDSGPEGTVYIIPL